jgi:Zn-finger nucleic acid-binding protein
MTKRPDAEIGHWPNGHGIWVGRGELDRILENTGGGD